MIKYIRFPFLYDVQQMQQEVNAVTSAWVAHFNRADYEGNWSGIALRAPGGEENNLVVMSHHKPFEDTALLKMCPYIKSVLESFLCVKTTVRLLKLEQGAVIKEHRDQGLNFEEGEVRLHIPVITHPLVEFYLDGDRLDMQEGTCWYINASLPHRLANHSPVDRIHLVIDCEVNDWLKEQFERTDLALKSEKDDPAPAYDMQQVINELRRSGDEARLQLADELEKNMDGQV
ncbi:aspartyl/asparaginyl beta-hydroxylase domain-containing protein [Chitinophagaceae bacterium MMS25-I14]